MNRKSIKERLKVSYFIIISLLIIPCIFSWGFLNILTAKYNRLITNIEHANNLNRIVKSDISNEMWDIVVGQKDFNEGKQYDIIYEINETLDTLATYSSNKKDKQLIDVTKRAMLTLSSYVDKMGLQIENNERVAEREKTLEEIRGVSILVSDVLQEFIYEEINDIGKVNQSIQTTTLISTVIILTIFIVAIIFAIIGFLSVRNAISFPILKLEYMAGEIAKGDLSVRVDEPEVEELKDLTKSLNIMADRIKDLIDNSVQEQRKIQKAEMRALQAQITPHFLYNTLDTIVWFGEQKKYQEVIRVTLAFASFFRISLSKGKDWITTAHEIEHVKNYLVIQSVKYGDILKYDIQVEERLNELPMLKLLLQPLVENAIYHGIKHKRSRGLISIRGWQEDEWVCFSIEDNGIGMKEERLEELRRTLQNETITPDIGFGTYNVHRRIRLYYEGSEGLIIESQYGEGTKVGFKLPIIKEKKDV